MPHSLNTLSFSDTLSKLREKVARRGINYSLNRLTASLAQLNHPEATLPSTIHIAGTNGKGSVAHYLTQALLKLNRRVITYTSPHIQCYTERFLVDGQPIQQHEFSDLFDAVSSADRHHQLSEYEMLTLMAFELVQRESPDIFIMETGLGGRLDATNVVPTSMAIITDIGLDHTTILGPTIEHIATEKAGIIKPYSHVITHLDHAPAIIEIIKTHAKQHHATIHWSGSTPNMHQRNKGLAATALNELLGRDDGPDIMSRIQPPFGRLTQSQYQDTPCRMDVGHNLHAAKAIHHTLPNNHPWIIGMSKEKALIPILRFLMGISKSVFLCAFRTENCWSMSDLPEDIKQNVQPWALGQAIQPNTLFFGSFYFIESLLKEAHNK